MTNTSTVVVEEHAEIWRIAQSFARGATEMVAVSPVGSRSFLERSALVAGELCGAAAMAAAHSGDARPVLARAIARWCDEEQPWPRLWRDGNERPDRESLAISRLIAAVTFADRADQVAKSGLQSALGDAAAQFYLSAMAALDEGPGGVVPSRARALLRRVAAL